MLLFYHRKFVEYNVVCRKFGWYFRNQQFFRRVLERVELLIRAWVVFLADGLLG